MNARDAFTITQPCGGLATISACERKEDANGAYQHALEIARQDLRAEYMENYSGGEVLGALQEYGEGEDDRFDYEIAEVKRSLCSARKRGASQDEIARMRCKLGEIIEAWLDSDIERYVSDNEEERALSYLAKKVR